MSILIFFLNKIIVRRKNRNIFSIHLSDWTWTIILEFFFCDQLFQLLIIFRNIRIQKNWRKKWLHSSYAVLNNDWTNNEIELTWLKEVFHLKIVNLKNKKFLLIDDYKSHESVKFIEYCWAIDIVFLCFSFYTTYYLQLLNVDCFESLIKAYKK